MSSLDDLEAMGRFNTAFAVEELLIAATEHWTWSVRPEQITLGTGVLALKRHCPTFGQMAPAEGHDLASAVAIVEANLRVAFEPDRINYVMLMMRDHHVHFHVVPRYAGPRQFVDRLWLDEAWPTAPSLSGDAQPMSVLLSMRDLLGAASS